METTVRSAETLADVMRELLAEHPRPEEFRTATTNVYDRALQDVIDGLEPIHDAVYIRAYHCDVCDDSRRMPDPDEPEKTIRCQDCLDRPGLAIDRKVAEYAINAAIAVGMTADDPALVFTTILRSIFGDPDVVFVHPVLEETDADA